MIAQLPLPAQLPVDPDAPEAQRWLIDELSKSAYQAAQPSWFDSLARQIGDWINSLINGLGRVEVPGGRNLLTVLLVVGIVVVLVIAFLVFGLPRLNRRSTAPGELFGDDDSRDAATLRRDAERSAAAGDVTTAIAEMFRALARGLEERTLVSIFPGSTASDVAIRAGLVFPDVADRLLDASRSFDGVRYLSRAGTTDEYQRLADLERDLRARRPPHDESATPSRSATNGTAGENAPVSMAAPW